MEDSTENTYMLADEIDVSSHSTLCDSIFQPLTVLMRYFGFNHYGPTLDDYYTGASVPLHQSEVEIGRVPRPPPSRGGGGH
ncbi:hypothetical protein SDJN03_14602, partial [Cucurbita argyrosperma subsp. sororia]